MPKSQRAKPLVLMKALIILVTFFTFILIFSVRAQTESPPADANEFEWQLYDDPVGTFASDPPAGAARAWDVIERNPEFYMTNDNILNAAFDNDMYHAGTILDRNPNLLVYQNVAARFEEAASSPEAHIQNANAFLNAHPDATGAWLLETYRLSSERGASYEFFDGTNLRTQGSRATTFKIDDFQGARINQDGSLSYRQAQFQSTTPLSVNPANGHVQMTGGVARVTRETRETSITLEVTDGIIYTGERGSTTSYRGSFILVQENGVTTVSSREGQPGFIYHNNIRVTGTISRRSDMPVNDFIIEGNAVLNKVVPSEEVRGEPVFNNNNLDSLRLQSSAQVYYSHDGGRGSAASCPGEMTCIVDSSTDRDVPRRTRFAVLDMTNNDEITFTTPAYYEHVEVINAHSGHVTFQSVDETQEVLGSIRVGARDDIVGQGDAIEQMNVGRIDVLYQEDSSCTDQSCRQILHHWSSTSRQGVAGYFQPARRENANQQQREPNALVRCTLDVDCEERIARTLGKVIGPPGRRPETTIIIGGDTSAAARSLEPWCQDNGCYVINSRDVTPTTTSTNLVVTGHHFGEFDYVWRESAYRVGTAHAPVDFLYVGAFPDEGGSLFDHVPLGRNVESLTFSSCNSAKVDQFTILDAATRTYPQLEQLQGWSGTAPPIESLVRPRVSIQNVPSYQAGATSGRTWYFRDGERWLWTRNGKECTIVAGGQGTIECPGSLVVAQR